MTCATLDHVGTLRVIYMYLIDRAGVAELAG
jgi:hypothetical protein